jgi:hypothetical protein
LLGFTYELVDGIMSTVFHAVDEGFFIRFFSGSFLDPLLLLSDAVPLNAPTIAPVGDCESVFRWKFDWLTVGIRLGLVEFERH